MALMTLLNAHLAYGHVALLDGANFSLDSFERVGLVGRNGTGKSSLLRILARLEKCDSGEFHIQTGLKIAYVPQESDLSSFTTVFDALSSAFQPITALIDEYTNGQTDMQRLDELQSQIEAHDGWNWEQQLDELLARFHLNPHTPISALSGGNKKRVTLAIGFAQKPQILLLDEPTNHLDLEAIEWLSELLINFNGSIITVSHDRSFLDAVTTKMIELDRGKLHAYEGNFSAFVAQKAERLMQEEVINAKADKLLAQEEIWIRKGVEARRTRAQARIERLSALRQSHAARKAMTGSVKFEVDVGASSGKLVSELTHVSKHFGEKLIVSDFSTIILRGDKVGLLGPNGAGKTTLLKLILGELAADACPINAPTPVMGEQPWGTIRLGSNVTVAYFDQMRAALDLNTTLEDFISPGSEWIEIGNSKKHVKSYLSDFLFSPARAHSPVSSLSGGERNRLLLARLFARPANVLVLDEPTNDLDIETLELLEDLLCNYEGTVFLVSHDRTFMNNVVSSTIAYEGNGVWREYEGSVDDWKAQQTRMRQAAEIAQPKPSAKSAIKTSSATTKNASTPTQIKVEKPSIKKQKEMDALIERIIELEAEQEKISLALASGDLFSSDKSKAMELTLRAAQIEQELEKANSQL